LLGMDEYGNGEGGLGDFNGRIERWLLMYVDRFSGWSTAVYFV
jgi:hypothetical protein